MILFKQDWDYYPNAIPDIQTTNKSFIKYSSLLKSMGVKNYLWPLALLNPKLQGVDPFSDDLTQEQKRDIMVECKLNRTYFFREVYRLPTGDNPSRFRAHRGNMALLWFITNNIDYCLIGPRQITGKSVGGDGITTHILNFGPSKSNTFLFTKDAGLRKTNVERLNKIREIIPRWLCPMAKDELNNTETVSVRLKENYLKTKAGQSSEDAARNVGRGETIAYAQIDEMPFIPNCHVSVPSLLGATMAAQENARLSKSPYGLLITTTAGMMDNDEGKYAYNFIHGGVYCNENLLMDARDYDDLVDIINKNKKGDRQIVNGTFNHNQLGYTDEEFFSKYVSRASGTVDEINMEYFNRWNNGSLSSPIPGTLLKIINANTMEPLYSSINKHNYVLDCYMSAADIHKHLSENTVIMSLDSSNAVGRDGNGLVFTDIKTAGVIATSSVTEGNINTYALWLAGLLIRYPKLVFIIENKSSGQSIIDIISSKLMEVGMDPFKRMYNNVVNESLANPTAYKDINTPLLERQDEVYYSYKGKIGFMTTGSRRAHLYNQVLMESVKSVGSAIRDKTIAEELSGLVQKNGRIDHATNGHDDMVISWLLGQWLLRHGKNLQHYGIDTKECLSMTTPNGSELSLEEIQNLQKRKLVLEEISEIKDRMASSPTMVESGALERVLKVKVKEAQQYGDQNMNIDSILQEVKERKVTKRSLYQSIVEHKKRAA